MIISLFNALRFNLDSLDSHLSILEIIDPHFSNKSKIVLKVRRWTCKQVDARSTNELLCN